MKMKSLLHSFVTTTLIGMLLTLSNAVLAAPLLSHIADLYVPGEVLVKFKSAMSTQASEATVRALGGAVQANLNNNVLHVKLGANQTVAETVAAYRNDPNVEYAQPNYIYHTTAVPTDPQYGQSWALKNSGQTITGTYTQPAGTPIYPTNNPGLAGNDMNIESAWNHITDCSSVVVAVVDSGVNYNQQDLAANMWNGGTTYPNHGYNYTGEGLATDPMDLNGHGTHVAGIIGAAGNNASGTTGVCWKASIMAVRVCNAAGQCSTATVIQGINFAVTNGAKVINMSLGAAGAFDTLYSNAITNAQTSDVVVVVAAGNDAKNHTTTVTDYPCDFTQPNLICVAALDQSYALASFSDWGATSVDVGAPGTNILSTWAGTNATLSDSLNAGWFVNIANWGYGTWLDVNGVSHTMLADPASWPNGTYPANADHHIYKNFNLSAYNTANLSIYLAGVVNSGDAFAVAMAPTGGDPFPSVTPLATGAINSPTRFLQFGFNINQCITAACTLGFALQSAASSAGAMGPAVTFFTIDTLALNTTSYNTENGTSMASPEVAGLATMLRAYNPQYSYADVVAAIKNAGRPTASLAGKTTTGKAVDVMASLAYINTPTGLTATVK
jgi:thermitase